MGLTEKSQEQLLGGQVGKSEASPDNGPHPDSELVARIQRGDRPAFDLLYERYFPLVYRFVDRRISIRADVEETTQEIFLNVFSSIDSYRGDAPLGAWIFGVSRRTIANRFRRKTHPTVPFHDENGETFADLSDGQSSPLEDYECAERIAVLKSRVRDRLSDEQRKLFELHHLEDLSINEIAQSLKKTENSVKSNLYRTRQLLLSR